MSFLANGKENVQNSGRKKSAEMPLAEPYPLEKLNWLIHLQHVRGETTQCQELIKQEIKRSGGRNEFAYFKQGIILREENRIQEALESFQTCMKLNPENVENVKEVGKCLHEMRRYRLSLEAYLEAEKLLKYPDWQVYYNIGQCYLRLGDSSKAKEYAQRAVQLGKHEKPYSLYMKILILEGDLKSAVSICNAAIESCPDSVDMLTEAGILYLKLGQTQHAFEKLSSALALNPICPKALLGIGCITQSHEEHDVALTKYKVAVTYDPNSVALWNNIGLCFHSKQKLVAAISCLKRALWISPTNWRVLFNLGLVHLATYQPASAFNFLCAAVNLRPDVPYSFIGLGCKISKKRVDREIAMLILGALFELNDSENATRAFKQALVLAPDDPLILINNILCLKILGCNEEAKRLLNKFNLLIEQNINISREVLALANNLSEYSEDSVYESIKEKDDALDDNANNGSKVEEEILTGFDESVSGNALSKELEPDEV